MNAFVSDCESMAISQFCDASGFESSETMTLFMRIKSALNTHRPLQEIISQRISDGIDLNDMEELKLTMSVIANSIAIPASYKAMTLGALLIGSTATPALTAAIGLGIFCICAYIIVFSPISALGAFLGILTGIRDKMNSLGSSL